ncbi:DNA-binding response OmpR family regulator [Flavobacterium gossypii]|jgi:Response regulators consisting of a CheY-like receiver domain and a winged-helix DNA-binding domain|uniref:DNA-binding response OmpR family regulator n=2 Tax=Flavobacterium TaxID=237 RepID=A0A495MN98_9FLAO|nr:MULTISPECIES: response regulator transcription factor [Flavobacterium]MBA9072856.1 DNA-binding response OmpR family regulator [Flavobacterium gossypii]RKS25869.1 DNA-binding response OmpR family regulator [Flavobacterium endophyticum]WDO13323.1 response regulator transcription factor [Flavobacterium sp. WW92]
MKLLIVEDEPNLLSIIRKGLSEKNNEVSVALDGTTALEMIHNHNFDVVILDIMLPDINGIEICRRLRASKNFVPILLLTALGTTENIVTGLNAGADDYLAKPFKFSELEARISALARRSNQDHKPNDTIVIDDLEIDSRSKTVKRNGEKIQLTAKEFKLLQYLARNAEVILSREKILDNVWDINFDMNTNVVDVYINYVRNKIDKPYQNKLIHTIKGLGYVIKP